MASSAVVGALHVLLGLDSAQFEDGLKKAQVGLSGFSKVAVGVSAVAGEALAGVAVAVGAAVKSAISRADELNKAAQKFGTTVTELSRLKYAADQSDVSLESLGRGLQRLSQNMSRAASGAGGEGARAFKALGVSVVDADGKLKSNTEVLTEVAGKFAGMQDSAGKTALAMAVFGQSGADLIPLLNNGADGLKRMTAEADALGVTLDEKTAAGAEAFNDHMTTLKLVSEGVGNQLAAAVLPALDSLSETIVDGAKNIEFMAEVGATLNGVLKVLSVSGVVVGAVFDATFKSVAAVIRAVRQVMAGDWGGAGKTLGQHLDSFDNIGGRISRAWNGTASGAARSGGGQAAAPNIPAAPGRRRRDQNDEVLDAAARDELAAQLALTDDIREQARLKADQLKLEEQSKKDKLDQQLAEGQITRATYDAAIATNAHTAALQQQALDQETADKLAAQEIADRDAIGRYQDAIASASADLAASTAEAADIEDHALEARQARERQDLIDQQAQDHLHDEAYKAEERRLQGVQQDLERQQQQRKHDIKLQNEQNAAAEQTLQGQIDLLNSQAQLAGTEIKRRQYAINILALEQRLERQKLEEVLASKDSTDAQKKTAQAQLDVLKVTQANQMAFVQSGGNVLDALDRAYSATSDMARAFKSHDWIGLTQSRDATIVAVQQAFASGGTLGGLGTIAGIVGQTAGGKLGKGVGGAVALGLGGSALGGALTSAGWGMTYGAAASGAAVSSGALAAGNALMAVGGALPIIGIVAGVGYLLSQLLGPKPTNHGAGYDLTTGQLSGDKRNSDTEQAATAAGQAIKQAEDQLTSLGVTLGTTIRGLVVGTRDPSQIYTSDGKTLTSATGDGTAAIETALKAVLQGATFVNDAEKKLVDDMLAAGKGFDDISSALQNFQEGLAAAQGLSKQFANAILELTDPNAAKIAELKDAQEERRKAVQEAADQGYLTADQLAALNAQLDQLDGLELDKTLQDIAQAGAEAGSSLRDTTSDLERARQAIRDFRDGLVGGDAALDPTVKLATAKAAFDAAAAGARAGDATAIGALADLGQSYLEALQAGATDARSYALGVNALKIGTAGFATGGSFEVGGFGGTDSQVTAFRATPGEMVSISHRDSMGDMAAALREMRGLQAEQGAALAAIARNTRQTAGQQKRWDGQGLPVRGAAPGDPVATTSA